MNRNRTDHFSNVPTPSMPRTKQDFGIHTRIQTFKHGHLVPFYARLVYPHSNLKQEMNAFIRMDTSIKVPMDDVYLDNYYFFVPFRILDPNFEKIMGHKDVYDDSDYTFPLMNVSATDDYPLTHDSLFNYLGWAAPNKDDASGLGYLTPTATDISDRTTWKGTWKITYTNYLQAVNTYLLAAYYKVWNEYFRDENLDPEIPIEDLLVQGSSLDRVTLATQNALFNNFDVLPVNRYHDMFSSGLVSPIKDASGDVIIPLGLGQNLPVITGDRHSLGSVVAPMSFKQPNGANFEPGSSRLLGVNSNNKMGAFSIGSSSYGNVSLAPDNLYADVQNTGTSVNQLFLSLALYSLYDKRGTFGSRLIEQIRGSFGLEVPDGLLDRAEYLGGNCQTLNNVPVLNTAESLGQMSGNSATLTGLSSYDKGINEWGVIIGVSCTRIKHTFNAGIQNHLWMVKDNLDLYWPEFANIGKVGIKNHRIFNNPSSTSSPLNDEVFNYNEPYIDEHTEIDFAAGDFGSLRDSRYSDLARKWSYQDLYQSAPIFSASWLKEPVKNIQRTLTGNLIPGAAIPANVSDGEYGGHQFMIEYKYHTQLTMPIPTHPHAPNITGRI